MSPRRGSKPRHTDRLVVGRNVTLTLTLTSTQDASKQGLVIKLSDCTVVFVALSVRNELNKENYSDYAADGYTVHGMLPPHIAEHSPRDLESGCEDSVLALARRMFGIRAECERRCV
jgi:hypothetical protein